MMNVNDVLKDLLRDKPNEFLATYSGLSDESNGFLRAVIGSFSQNSFEGEFDEWYKSSSPEVKTFSKYFVNPIFFNSENAKAEVTVSPNGDFKVKGGAEIAGRGSLVAGVEMKDENLVAGASYQTKIGDSVVAEVNANYGKITNIGSYNFLGLGVQATW